MQGVFYILKSDAIKDNAIKFVSSINTREQTMCVKIEAYSETRSQQQNRYLWGWVYSKIVEQLNDSGQVISLDNGREMQWTNDLLHEAFKTVFLAMPPIKTSKGEIKQYKSTASLNKKEFSEYLENIDRACAGWWPGISVPAPDGMWKHLLEG